MDKEDLRDLIINSITKSNDKMMPEIRESVSKGRSNSLMFEIELKIDNEHVCSSRLNKFDLDFESLSKDFHDNCFTELYGQLISFVFTGYISKQ